MTHHLIDEGSVRDISCSLQNGNYSIEYLENQIQLEELKLNRSTVIQMLRGKINKKKKGVAS